MTSLVAVLLAYLIGSAPTANALAGRKGIDLRRLGSGNPGTNNARILGGYGLAASILAVEFAKGAAASGLGWALGSETTAVVAGIAAIAGNVYNVWYRFQGGKGLAISGGVLLTLWPTGLIVAVIAIAALAALTKSSGMAAAGALAVLALAGAAWPALGYPNAWGIGETGLLPFLAGAMVVLIVPKHVRDIRARVTPPSRP